MTTLLEWKEKLVHFYGKYEVYLAPVLRFLTAFTAFMMIEQNIGYMKNISTVPAALLLALISSVLPAGGMMFLASLVVLADLYALALEVCIVGLVLFLLIYFLYLRFSPAKEYGIVLTPICFMLRIPYVMPIGMGLLRELYSVISMICGTVLYFFLSGVKKNAAVLGAAVENDASTSKFVIVLNQLIGNREMYLVLAAMVLTMLIVYLIRRLSMEHAWPVAILSGSLFQTIVLLAGYMLLEIDGKMLPVLLGNAAACLIAFVIQFVCFNLDYSRTERLQFEDDEYYYYVKAVPKAIVSGSEKTVKRFNSRETEEQAMKKRFAEEMEIDENLLD